MLETAGTPAATLLGVLGLLVGSFLNVVIHRLPRMMELRWAAECAELQSEETASATAAPEAAPFNLMVPRSRCPHCGHQIRWHENIPVLSYLALRGKCSQCATPISARYPAVEFTTAVLFAWCGWHWGLGGEALAWSGFSAALLALACIDWDTTLLPDDITLPLLWAGLCAAGLRLTGTALPDALWGAVGGYLSLWLVYWAFKLITGKEGMGYGDFKLFAALGAWFGWQALVPVILMASVIGAVIGIVIKLKGNLREGGYVPFGPFLALAGLTAMVFGPSAILAAIGL
ncbi:prepilin peptidase [Hydrogenophaga laconesensis]|uniref:Prepilin leader peptidase/N-methyltransferase n=1 Tax=Hydrogenophaga laconesensis TaxID=1805971 RepID=A0ABU1VAJ5_9BURK|nr:A24 family peptidase [Hydrogenophaga laconesensis]MDR7094484.1 leader peptidase (prepilin peptidase)/N-methyltransferase [Hydrogenophaga laconesensis]